MDALELVIEKMVPGGLGLARWEGRVVFVSGAAPGDRIRGRVTATHRHHLMVRCETILEAGPDTVDPGCDLAGSCGGCPLRRLSASHQEAVKAGFVFESLERIARLDPTPILHPLIPAQQREGYRRRATFQARWDGARMLLGFFAHGSHDIVDLTQCPVLDPRLSALIDPLRQLLAALKGRGSITQVEVVAGDDALGVVFCLMRPCTHADKDLMRRQAGSMGIDQVWMRIGQTAMRPLTRQGELGYAIDGFRIAFEPGDFVQSHAAQNRVLVEESLKLAGEGNIAWDLFCGIGNFTLPLTRRFHTLLGADLISGSLRRAGENAKKQGLEHISFQQVDLFRDEGLARLPWREQVDAVLLDPPRNGAEALCRQLATRGPQRIVHISCDPATFARDAAILINGGYTLERVHPVDLFPQTRHVETIARFLRRSSPQP
ncbi:MAG: hypothetical protein HQM00_02140 [Magnetococcales bacterium]|nr:hypothetical protein [Magnetococcales bacterium]